MKLTYRGSTPIVMESGHRIEPGAVVDVSDADGAALVERDPELWKVETGRAPKKREALGEEEVR